MNLGPAEILVILVLALIVFGPKRLPEVGRQVGGALREIRKVQHTVRSEINEALREPTPTLPPAGRPGNGAPPKEAADDHEAIELQAGSGDPASESDPRRDSIAPSGEADIGDQSVRGDADGSGSAGH